MVSVFVTGSTGFIAQHIVKLLLDQGHSVVGSVRSEEKGEKLKKNLGSSKFSYEIVRDIGEKGAFDQALKNHPEITVFMHTASPFHFETNDPEKDLLHPAINGTKYALQSVLDNAPQVKKVVVTSSYAAITTPSKEYDPEVTLNENSWNDMSWEEAKMNAFFGYFASKAFAEKAAWEFIEIQKPNFTLTTVNPSYVFGPQAFDSEVKDTLNTSSEIINSILKLGPNDELPPTKGGFIDVRDVAKAHLKAFEDDATTYKRLLLSNKRFHTQDIADILHENFPELKIPVGEPGSGKSKTTKMATVNRDATKKLLGFEFIDLKTSVVDTTAQILKNRK